MSDHLIAEAAGGLAAADYITITQAAKLAPGRPSINTVWRWVRKGVKSRAGQRVRLRCIRAGGKLLTRPEWVEQFSIDLAEADQAHFAETAERYDTDPHKKKRTATARQRSIARAEATLAEAGI